MITRTYIYVFYVILLYSKFFFIIHYTSFSSFLPFSFLVASACVWLLLISLKRTQFFDIGNARLLVRCVKREYNGVWCGVMWWCKQQGKRREKKFQADESDTLHRHQLTLTYPFLFSSSSSSSSSFYLPQYTAALDTWNAFH